MKQTLMPGLSGGDTGASPRVLVLMALLVVMLGVGGWMRLSGDTTSEMLRVMERVEGEDEEGADTTDWPKWNPATETWGAVDDQSARTQALIPVGALKVASRRVEGFSWNNLAYSGAFKRLNMAAVFADSPLHRGEPIEVIGELMQLRRVDVFDRYNFKVATRTELWEGVLKPWKSQTGSEAPILFLMVDMQDADLGEKLLVGDAVKLQGIFFKLQEFHLLGSKYMGPWILGKRLLPNFRFPTPEAVQPDLIGTGVDDVDLESGLAPFFQEGLFHLMAAAANRSEFLYEDVRTIRGVRTRELLKEPQTHRGQTLELTGRVIRVEEHKMQAFFPQNKDGDHAIDRFWIAYITSDGTVPMSVMTLEPPPEDLTTKSVVDLKATFFRVWGFKSANGWSVSPLLVAVSGLSIRAPVEETPDLVAYGIFILGVLIALVVGVVLYKDRRGADLQERSLRARRKLRQGRIDLNRLADDTRGSDRAK